MSKKFGMIVLTPCRVTSMDKVSTSCSSPNSITGPTGSIIHRFEPDFRSRQGESRSQESVKGGDVRTTVLRSVVLPFKGPLILENFSLVYETISHLTDSHYLGLSVSTTEHRSGILGYPKKDEI